MSPYHPSTSKNEAQCRLNYQCYISVLRRVAFVLVCVTYIPKKIRHGTEEEEGGGSVLNTMAQPFSEASAK